YLEETVKVSNVQAAVATIPVLVIMSLCLPLIGRLSDRMGRKFVFMVASGATIVLIVPAFAVMQIGTMTAVIIALFMVAIPAGFYIACLASTLPALFPTASRYGAMGLTFNLGVSLFGGTTPLFAQALIDVTGNSYMPAFYIMFFSVIAFIAVCFIKESASVRSAGPSRRWRRVKRPPSSWPGRTTIPTSIPTRCRSRSSTAHEVERGPLSPVGLPSSRPRHASWAPARLK